MTINERALQVWSVLAFAAQNRQILMYDILSRLIGAPAVAMGPFLEPIQAFCIEKGLPPLTVIVVKKETGIPGIGFTASKDIPAKQMDVFEFDWIEYGAPSLSNLGETITKA